MRYADETTLPTLSPGSGKTKTAWLWTYARDDGPFGGQAPPMVAYRFEDWPPGRQQGPHGLMLELSNIGMLTDERLG